MIQTNHRRAPAPSWWIIPVAALMLATRAFATPPRTSTDLPITEVPVAQAARTGKNGNDLFAVMISGDGGWARLDQELSAEIADAVLSVARVSPPPPADSRPAYADAAVPAGRQNSG